MWEIQGNDNIKSMVTVMGVFEAYVLYASLHLELERYTNGRGIAIVFASSFDSSIFTKLHFI